MNKCQRCKGTGTILDIDGYDWRTDGPDLLDCPVCAPSDMEETNGRRCKGASYDNFESKKNNRRN